MSRMPSRPVRSRPAGHARPITAVACLVFACFVIASPAEARIGGLIKKAKDRVTKTAEQKGAPGASTDGGTVEFDDRILELTGDRLDRIIATFRKSHELSAGRPALVEKLNKVDGERSTLLEKNWEAIQAVRMKRSEVETCYHDGYQEAQDRRTEEYRNKALTDPAIREKFARAAQENNAAAARGDSAAIQRIMATLREATSPTREDSTRVRQTCGPLPARLASEDRLDAQEKEIAALQEKIRQIDDKVAEAQAREGGLERGQWAMALERIQMYLAWSQSNPDSRPAPRGFSAVELEALEKRLEQLLAELR